MLRVGLTDVRMTQGEASHLSTQRKPRCVGHPASAMSSHFAPQVGGASKGSEGSPSASKKFLPSFKYNDLTQARRVLDVACGPGTNAGYFGESDYIGIDLNECYIQ